MSVIELEQAIINLPKPDYHQLMTWLVDYDQQQWDKEIEIDQQNGSLTAIINQAFQQIERGEYRAI